LTALAQRQARNNNGSKFTFFRRHAAVVEETDDECVSKTEGHSLLLNIC
jgi:hypothetical protein